LGATPTAKGPGAYASDKRWPVSTGGAAQPANATVAAVATVTAVVIIKRAVFMRVALGCGGREYSG